MTEAFFDTECYPNYWLLKIKPRGLPTFTFELFEGESLNATTVATIRSLFTRWTSISFNGRGYDKWMIGYALDGATPDMLKQLNDKIIVERIKPWELGLPEWDAADHIDVMEVAPGAGSQKQYAGRIHCKTMRDLPYSPDHALTDAEAAEVAAYCENDLVVLEALYDALAPQIKQRVILGQRYGLDLRSKSDAQVAEAVLKRRCEDVLGRRIYKPEIDWGMRFMFQPPPFIGFTSPHLCEVFRLVCDAVFQLGASGAVEAPESIEGLEVVIGQTTYKIGIGGLHSQEKKLVVKSNEHVVIRRADVASYYPSMILNSGEVPSALGPAFAQEYAAIKRERLAAKQLQAKLKKQGDTSSPEYEAAQVGNEGGKIMINGTFGKTCSPYSVLWAPTMLIQTTMTGQLSLLMLIEWHEAYGIPVVSANTDDIVIKCPRHLADVSSQLIKEWERRTGLEMEVDDYVSLFARDVNNYFCIKTPDDVKRKGEYARAGLIEKKNPDVEICSDAVAEFLAKGTPLLATLLSCRDIRKFVAIQKVAGGGVKMWGEGPRKDTLVRDMIPRLEAHGWRKQGHRWCRHHGGQDVSVSAAEAYASTFTPQRPEYLGKVIRWYYSTEAAGPILYETNGNTVGGSYGAHPLMTLPDEFPANVDYRWYLNKCDSILRDIGYYTLM